MTAAARLALAGGPGSVRLNTLVTVDGTDVFAMVSVGGTNDAVPVSLMRKLIGRVQKLR
jgi:hypothetical protein